MAEQHRLIPADSPSLARYQRLAKPIGVGLLVLLVAWLSLYTIQEGHVGIVKRFGKAIRQVDPGIHLKIPLVDGVEEIEVRQRKNVEELAAATANQLPIQAAVSINWTVEKASAMDLFIKYGGLEQFENRILDPKLRSAAKAALAQFPADQLIRNRQAAVAAIMDEMIEELEDFPLTVNSPQIENIALPPTYQEAVLEKERARENAEQEKHTLERQRLVALQAVNSAEANATAKRLEADAEAYRVTAVAEAEATAIRLINAQLEKSPRYVDLVKAKQWNGVLPQTMLAEDGAVLFSIREVPGPERAGQGTLTGRQTRGRKSLMCGESLGRGPADCGPYRRCSAVHRARCAPRSRLQLNILVPVSLPLARPFLVARLPGLLTCALQGGLGGGQDSGFEFQLRSVLLPARPPAGAPVPASLRGTPSRRPGRGSAGPGWLPAWPPCPRSG